MSTKGIILAGGRGTRLYPLTSVVCKQLLPVYDKPMIYYPLATLMLGGIREILIISTSEDIPLFKKLLGNGEQFGISIEYAVQDEPAQGKVISIEEKPTNPKSRYAIPGLYIFDSNVSYIAENVEPSERGEKEITSVQNAYLNSGKLRVELIGRGIAWLDTGTPESLLEAGQFISVIERRQNMKVACLEEIALQVGFISLEEFEKSVDMLPNSLYKEYCKKILLEK